MTQHPSRRTALALAATLAAGLARAEVPKGAFGFAAKVEADGVFNPTLKTVHIQSVQAGLPGALAGIAVGDSIIEVDGAKVAGAKAAAMAERMKKKPGETLVLRLQRANGETYVVTLRAAAPTSVSSGS